MNPATFNALRSAIGLEQQTIASALGLGAHGKRSVERWCATITPPAHAVTYLLEMVDRYDKFLEGEMEQIDLAADTGRAIDLIVFKNEASFLTATDGKSGLPGACTLRPYSRLHCTRICQGWSSLWSMCT